jgi:hypothetical protein
VTPGVEPTLEAQPRKDTETLELTGEELSDVNIAL